MWNRIGIAVLVLESVFACRTVADPKPVSPVRLTVSVLNDAGVTPSVLSAAQARAENVLHEAGISLTWLDCGTPGHWATNIGCTTLLFPSHLSVRLVQKRAHPSPDTFGESYVDERGEGNYALVYLAGITSSKQLKTLSEGELLGYVIVHELGHLLLGADSHSATGVMRGVWQFDDLQKASRGRLFFTTSQSDQMRSRLLAVKVRDVTKGR